MKKMTIIFIACLTLILLIGCGANASEKLDNRFDLISSEKIKDGTNNGITLRVLVDKETKVMYLLTEKFQSGYGVGLQVMVDKDGKPLIYNK